MLEPNVFNLTLIRHAKSSWKDMELSDHQRPLSKRGKRNIPIMVENNSALLNQIDHFYCSSAVRAKTVIDVMAKSLDIAEDRITIDDSFYTFSSYDLLASIKRFPDHHQSTAVIAHNPGLTELINQLTQSDILNLPTTGIARIRLTMNSWSEIDNSPAKLIYFDCPKNYP